MASLRDPGTAAMEADELARAQASVVAERNQKAARRSREAKLKGNPAARRDLAKDYAAVNAKERRRAVGG